MEDGDKRALRSLLVDTRVATLAVQIQDQPFASLVPFAMSDSFDAAQIHASRLAWHSEGLTSGAPFSLLIHEQDTRLDTNPAQLARVTLQGRVEVLERDTDEYSQRRDRYLAKFPKSEITFQLGDFTLYALRIESCRYVAGFGKAFDVKVEDLQALS